MVPSTPLSLPTLPPLPPLQMPDTPSPSLPLSQQTESLQSPAPSFASKDSFSTAYTSTSQADIRPLVTRSGASSLAPPQTLRKSISVDSFVKYAREPRSPTGPLPHRGSLASSSKPMRGPTQAAALAVKRERESRSQDHHSAWNADPDIERSDIHNSVERHRHSLHRGPDYIKPSIRGGELPLPSRTPTLSSTSSVSSMVSASTNSSTLEDIQDLRSHSLQSMPRRGTTSSLPAIPGRSRSGSLGVYAPANGKRVSATTQHETPNSQPAVTLVVVGTPGCGKSVAIHKGLKSFSLSEPTTIPGPANSSNPTSARYTRRRGRINNENPPDCLLDVIEIDIPMSGGEVSLSGELLLREDLPHIDGVIICYDSSDDGSFRPIEALLHSYRAMKLPTVVLACKCDLERRVEPERALEVLQRYDVGLVEVAHTQELGKEKMKRSFDWLLRSVFRARRSIANDPDRSYRNPASPEVLTSLPPWDLSRTATPTGPSVPAGRLTSQTSIRQVQSTNPLPPISTLPPTSPTRVRSVGDLLHEQEQSGLRRHGSRNGASSEYRPYPGTSVESLHKVAVPSDHTYSTPRGPAEETKPTKDKESTRPAQWATLDELLDKLLFLAVSGDDPAFITHFLLTYRRFAIPRSVLLAMQKKMRQLDNPSGDPMFACFAQMRICNLLEQWIRDYPYDFAVRGTAGALNALIKSIISKTYLLHYGSEFLPFLELLPSLVDQDSAWALKADIDEGSDDSYSPLEDDEEARISHNDPTFPVNETNDSTKVKPSSPVLSVPSRERKSSLPLPKSLIFASGSSSNNHHPDVVDVSPKQQIKDLIKLAQEVMLLDPDEIAQEITRVEVKLFLDIQPRHWLQYTFVSGKKDPETEPISAFNAVSNHLAGWVVSLILCHEKPKARAKQIEKFVEIAQRLRALNNYSALRAFVAGINDATYSGDETLEHFKTKSPEQAKNLQSWDVLLQHLRSHRAYRLALRNTKGACIPALEVHMSDLIKAHEGNDDGHSTDPTKIHWGKFNMMGRFINHTIQCQAQCRMASDYNFPDRNAIAELFVKRPVMTEQMRQARIGLSDADVDDYRPVPIRPSTQPRDAVNLRKLFFW